MNRLRLLTKFPVAPVVLIVGVLLIIGVVSTIFYTNQECQKKWPLPNPNQKLSYTGAITYFSSDSGIKSSKENCSSLDYISLFWYQVNHDGSISRRDEIKDKKEADFLSFVKQNNKSVLVGIKNDEDSEIVDTLLDYEDMRKKHISEVLDLLKEKGYDGVVIDYENLREDQTEGFTDYMKELATALRSKGKIISISVNTETSGRVFHGIDVVEVSKVVDRLELNAYPEFGNETGPGPIASIDWVNTIIKNLIDQGVEPSKIILGTAHSGHDWITSPNEEFFNDTTTKEVLNTSSEKNAKLKWDEKTQSNFFEYKDEDGKKHVVWLEDSRSFKAKIDLAESYKLQGVFIWYLGGEDPRVWNGK
ncbi:hypothetical protein IH981_01695 [Patescibacteria group bacterium]|nr:hypothetical protein [Patescibacteria group bacterium]